jgi:thiol-disulfide isomerase/thioredoxin
VGDAPAAEAWLSGHTALLSELSRRRATDAKRLLTATEEALSDLKPENTRVASLVTRTNSTLSSLAQQLAVELRRAELIGQPAIAIENASWVNGSTLTPEELKGKVVLLDFWAVWCGPCIATFPHLREWNEKYSDRGFVIIGVTRHYGYGWDEVAQRPMRVENISPSDEQAAMVQFAKHHKLEHTFAVMPSSELAQKYGVTGIPQAVVIDRQGTVRMIRVGSGEPNAKDLEEMIETALAERVAASAGGQ